MFYFSYGSNMSRSRLVQRVPSSKFVAVASLPGHELRFHKSSKDGSGKCDAFQTNDTNHKVIGVVYEISKLEKPALDRKEGLGFGYEEKLVKVVSMGGKLIEAVTYYATNIDSNLKPYHWYKEHVVKGARENGLPESYVQFILKIESIEDNDTERNEKESAIYR